MLRSVLRILAYALSVLVPALVLGAMLWSGSTATGAHATTSGAGLNVMLRTDPGLQFSGSLTASVTAAGTVTITGLQDYYEIHYPTGAEPARCGLQPGSSSGWWRIAGTANGVNLDLYAVRFSGSPHLNNATPTGSTQRAVLPARSRSTWTYSTVLRGSFLPVPRPCLSPFPTSARNVMVMTTRFGSVLAQSQSFSMTGHVDQTPPVIAISGVSDGQYSNAAALTPTFSATDDDLASVSATLDGVRFVSGRPVSAEGAHTLVVTASDQAGNQATATVHFTLDRTPPTVQIATPADGGILAAPAVPIGGTAQDNTAIASITINGQPASVAADGSFHASVTLAEGAHTITVIATDRAGNQSSATAHVTLDITPPSLQVSSPAQGARIAALSTSVSGTAQDATGVLLTVNGQPVTVAADGHFHASVTLTEGANTIQIVTTDLAGNVTSVTRHVRANTTPPTLSVTGPQDGLATSTASVQVTGAASPADPADAVTVTVDGQPATVAADGSFQAPVALTEGTNIIQVVATDGYGLQNTQSVTVVQDALPPAIAISGVSDGQYSNAAALTPAFSATDANLAGVSATLDGAPFASGSPVSAEGAHTLVVTAGDHAGNQATATVRFTLDRTPPAVQIASPAEGARIPALIASVSGTAQDNTAIVSITINGQAAPMAANGNFSTNIPLAPGANTITVVATDAAGNVTSVILHVRANTTPPALSVTGPQDGLVTSTASVQVTGAASPGDPADAVSLSVNGQQVSVAADGSFSATVSVAPGSNTITVVVTDGYGLQSTQSVTVTMN